MQMQLNSFCHLHAQWSLHTHTHTHSHTVIVPPDLRGRGLGRRVMEEAERYAASVGNETMHLSTHDKQSFYTHLGYTDGSRVTPLRRCVAKLANEQVCGEIQEGTTCD